MSETRFNICLTSDKNMVGHNLKTPLIPQTSPVSTGESQNLHRQLSSTVHLKIVLVFQTNKI